MKIKIFKQAIENIKLFKNSDMKIALFTNDDIFKTLPIAYASKILDPILSAFLLENFKEEEV